MTANLDHRQRLADDEVRLDRAKRLTEGRRQRARIRSGAAHEERDAVVRKTFVGKIEIRARPIGEAGAEDVADDADDLGVLVVDPDATADRVLAGEELTGHRFAHDHDRRRAEAVARAEQPPGAKRNPHRLEVAARRDLPSDVRRPLASRPRPIRSDQADRPVVAAQRRDHGGADGVDA